MTTLEQQQQSKPTKGELKLNLNLEQPIEGQNLGTKTSTMGKEEKNVESKEEEPLKAFQQILNSLKDTQKYLPTQFNTFVESMEGKSLDDLKNEAVHLANKAQEEAKKKTEEVSNYGKASLESARSTAQDVVDMASQRTSEMADKVQKATAEKTSGIANQGLEIIKPYAMKAKEYLPEDAKTFVEENVQGKTIEELRDEAVLATRKSLLGATNEKTPSFREFASEVNGALWSGTLFRNALQLSERAVEKTFGPTNSPKDAGPIRRVFDMTTTVGSGLKDFGQARLNQVQKNSKDMLNRRVMQARETIMPVREMAGPYLAPLPIIGRWFSEYRSQMPLGGSGLQEEATRQWEKGSREAGRMMEKETREAGRVVDQGAKEAGRLVEEGTQAVTGSTPGEWKDKVMTGLSKSSESAANVANAGSSTPQKTTVHVDVQQQPQAGLKPYPTSGMGSVSLGGTTVTAEPETKGESGKKKQSKA